MTNEICGLNGIRKSVTEKCNQQIINPTPQAPGHSKRRTYDDKMPALNLERNMHVMMMMMVK